MKVVYLDHGATCDCASPFSSGEAGTVWIGAGETLEIDTRVRISPNSLHALHGLGVVEQLNGLPLAAGPIGEQRQAMIGPAQVTAAMRIFYEADRNTYGEEHDLLVAQTRGPEPAQFRVKVDNREYQRTLSQLQFLSRSAARMGRGIWLRV